MSTRSLSGLAVVLLAALFVTTAQAAEPNFGTLSKGSKTTAWTGSSPTGLPVPNQAGCLGPNDPSCDGFSLTVNLKEGARFAVAITTQIEGDDYDLFIYFPDGSEVARSATASGNEAVVVENTAAHGVGPYQVRVLPYSVSSGSAYQGIASKTRDTPMEGTDLTTCLEATPATIGVVGITDSGQIVSLDVAVLLDGVAQSAAQQILTKAAESYAPLRINLHVVSYHAVSFVGTEGSDMIQQAKDFFGGERPSGSDVVFVLTNKDLTSDGDNGLVGLADCIGGVRFATRAFAVAEASGIDPVNVGPFVLEVDAHPEAAAHEIGHLMGAHHHYANCVEGNLTGAANDVSPCTLMFNFVDFLSLNFSQVNGPIVRGHAVQFASP